VASESKTSSRRRRRTKAKQPRCECIFDWGVELALLPDGSAVAWARHEWPRCPLAAPPSEEEQASVQPHPTTARASAPRPPKRAAAAPHEERWRTTSAIETVLSAVELVTDRAPRRVGEGRYMALCRAHADRRASLSIRDTSERVLLHCFAGCATEAVLDALRLGWPDLFENRR
jgi:hypothetical protein